MESGLNSEHYLKTPLETSQVTHAATLIGHSTSGFAAGIPDNDTAVYLFWNRLHGIEDRLRYPVTMCVLATERDGTSPSDGIGIQFRLGRRIEARREEKGRVVTHCRWPSFCWPDGCIPPPAFNEGAPIVEDHRIGFDVRPDLGDGVYRESTR